MELVWPPPTQTRILEIAAKLEPDEAECLRWFHEDGLAEFGGCTARDLIERGHGHKLEGYLKAILAGERD